MHACIQYKLTISTILLTTLQRNADILLFHCSNVAQLITCTGMHAYLTERVFARRIFYIGTNTLVTWWFHAHFPKNVREMFIDHVFGILIKRVAIGGALATSRYIPTGTYTSICRSLVQRHGHGHKSITYIPITFFQTKSEVNIVGVSLIYKQCHSTIILRSHCWTFVAVAIAAYTYCRSSWYCRSKEHEQRCFKIHHAVMQTSVNLAWYFS